MERQEKIQRLMERMNVTQEEAAQALDACGEDLLEAALHLERGKPAGERVVHTHSTAAALAVPPEAAREEDPAKGQAPAGDKVTEVFIAILTGLVNHPILNGVRIDHKGKPMVTIPAVILLALFLVRYWIVLGLGAVGLLVGWNFAWVGPQWGNTYLNAGWAALERKAAQLRESMKGGHRRG